MEVWKRIWGFGRRSLLLTTALWLVVFAGLLTKLVIAVVHFRIMDQFTSLEVTRVKENAARAWGFIENTTSDLAIRVREYAFWDDLTTFLKERNPGFAQRNFPEDSLRSLGVDLVMIWQGNAEVLFITTQTASTPVVDGDRTHWINDLNRLLTERGEKPLDDIFHGLMILQDRPIATAIAPIRRSDRSGETGAYLLFGQWLDDAWLNRMANSLQATTSVAIQPFPESSDNLVPDISWKIDPSVERVTLDLLIPTGPDRPAILFQNQWHSAFLDQGRKTVIEVAVAIMVVSLGAIIYLLVILHGLIFGRLGRLARKLETMDADTLRQEDRLVEGHDEIGRLGMALLGAVRRVWQGEHELAQKEAKHQAVLEQLPEGIFLIDPVKWRFQEWNPACLQLLGERASVLERESWPTLVPESIPPWNEVLDNLEQKGRSTLQLWRKREGGVERKLEVNLSRVIMEGETLICGMIEDLTERDRLQETVRRAEMAETVGTLAGGVAHDFNNLLTVIMGGIEMLRSGEKLTESGRESLEAIDQASRSATDLTRKLLFYGRKSALQMEVIDVNRLLRNLQPVLVRVVPENIRLELSTEENLPQIRGDVRSLEQVLLNLVLNARDAMPGGGKLVIITSSDVGTDGQTKVCIGVRDSGVGIPPEVLTRMFEPFFTTKPPGQGSGLGLSMVDGIVRQHGGEVRVESSPGQGTSFWIRLPATTENVTMVNPEIAEVSKDHRASVVLVEDEAGIRNLLTNMLIRSGFVVESFPSGREALDWHRSNRQPFDVLVSDVIMPGDVSGFELAASLLTHLPDLKIILISGYNQEMFGNQSLEQAPWEADKFRFLEKPFGARRLLEEINNLLGD
jgi:PAS domain S-box-containing protein